MIPESHLVRRDTGVGLSNHETIQQVDEIETGGGWESQHYLKKEIESWDYNGRWRSALGPFVVEIAGISYLSAERFLEHIKEPLRENSDFDINTYGNTTLSIFKKLGRAVGDHYTSSYPYVVGASIDHEKYPDFKSLSPEKFHDFIQKCGVDGGREFARWMADASIAVLYAGGNLEEFKAAALEIRKKGGAKLVKPFAQNAGNLALARRQEVFFQDFEQLTIEALDKLGRDATYWLLRVLPTLVAKHKVNPFDFVHDMEDMADEQGQRAAKQFLAGLSKNIKTLKDVKEEEAETRLKKAEEAFCELRDTTGKTAASFFSYRGMDLASVEVITENKIAIADFKAKTPPKVFQATTWFGADLTTLELPHLLSLIRTYAKNYGIEAAVREIQYASRVMKKNHYLPGFPALHPYEYFGQDERVKLIWGPYDGEERFWDRGGSNPVDLDFEAMSLEEREEKLWNELRTEDDIPEDLGTEFVDEDGVPIGLETEVNGFPEVTLLEGHQYRLL